MANLRKIILSYNNQIPVTAGFLKVPSVRLACTFTSTPFVLSFASFPFAVTMNASFVPEQAYVKLVLSVLIVPAYAVHVV